MGQTVNLLSYDFEGSNPSLPTNAFWQGIGKGKPYLDAGQKNQAEVAHLVEHQPSKLRVAGSSPVSRSTHGPFILFCSVIKLEKNVFSDGERDQPGFVTLRNMR